MNRNMFGPSLSIWMSFCHIVYCSLGFSDQFLGILRFLDLRKNVNFDFHFVKRLDNEQM